MTKTRSHGSRMRASIVALVLGGLVACESQEQGALDQGGGSEESLTIALSSVPASTLCIRVTARPSSGSAPTVKSFIVSPGSSSANLQMGVLLPETYSLIADAFNVACTSASGAGTWIADPVTATVRPGVAATVTMTFRKNNPLVVNANFVNNVKAVISGYTSNYIITDSSVLVAGNNITNGAEAFTRLDFAGFDPSSTPGNAVVSIAPTANGACALREDGTVWCWGHNQFGALGPGTIDDWVATPTQIAGISNAKSIAAGLFHVCAARPGYYVKCWGRNNRGQLGDGTIVDSASPVTVLSGTYYPQSLAAGAESTYMLDEFGNLISWGANTYGQLGDGGSADSPTPVSVALPAPPLSVSAGQYFACALAASGAVFCWGGNGVGQLGDGTTTNRLTPTLVPGLVAKQVVSGIAHSCALTVPGETVCWGGNRFGHQLGNRTNQDSTTFTSVALEGVTLTSLSSHIGYTTCGISTNLDVYCWGYNQQGQLGNGTHTSSSFPVRAQVQ